MYTLSVGGSEQIMGYSGAAGAMSPTSNQLICLNPAMTYNAVPPATLTANASSTAMSGTMPYLRFKIV